jgi:hypothetical protein
MNPQAYEILTKMKVNIPQEYCIDQVILNQNRNNYYYCRFSSKSELKSGLFSGKEIQNNIHLFNQLQHNNELIRIEEVVNCLAGCVIYINNGNIYGEFVLGHIMTLLRKGVCLVRFLIDSDNGVYFRHAYQHQLVTQKGNKFNYYHDVQYDHSSNLKIFEGFDELPNFSVLQDLIVYLRSIDFTLDNSLYEIMVSKDKYVFCDAKIFSVNDFFINAKKLFDNEGYKIEIIARNNPLPPHGIIQLQDGFFDVDNKEFSNFDNDTNYDVYILHSAFLCHFITRNFKRFNSLIYLKAASDRIPYGLGQVRYTKIDELSSTNGYLNHLLSYPSDVKSINDEKYK